MKNKNERRLKMRKHIKETLPISYRMTKEFVAEFGCMDVVYKLFDKFEEFGGNAWVLTGDEPMWEQFSTTQDHRALCKLGERYPRLTEKLEKVVFG